MSIVGDVPTALVASSSFVREGLTSFLNGTRFRVVAVDAGASEADGLAPTRSAPALILAALDDAHSIEAARTLRERYPDAKLVVFGRAEAPATLPKDLCFGAQAVLDRDIGRETLIKALDVVMSGVTVQSSGLFSWLLDRPKAPFAGTGERQQILVGSPADAAEADGAPCHPLSSRELNVLRCLADGASNKVIALKFDLAEATVKIHVKNILRKLKTQNRTQAAIWAREHGIYPR
ncbi:LuxR C-terminal-related transcriptional regulator [Methylobacterium planeticum]|uniref:Response regulator transcription factor n=1 Tax=Methylobacterium planeticum TaxID=2615211 RepID=A0A6N6N0M9_9HYPH|nr:response regulator transcription factor [Methylobacterium planeticum]KAB1075992.1 response regulator transcription factor [Methylobacterium planeticum]